MQYAVSPNLKALHEWESKALYRGKPGPQYVGGILEGSSRSFKTISSIDFILYLCSQVEGMTFNIIKETYNSFKTTLYNDFNFRLPMYGIASPFQDRQDVRSFKLFGNTINFLGADSDTVIHGVGSDYLYFNEMLDIPQSVFDQLEMRCRRFWWGDYNPKFTDHWLYRTTDNRKDLGHIKTTFKDNAHLAAGERRKIMGYNPNNPDNVAAGTADDYMWNVYGLGLRSAPEGVVFQHVTWIPQFPTNVGNVYYGMDFGFTTDPSTLVRMAANGRNLYIENLLYEPTPTAADISKHLDLHKVKAVVCDNQYGTVAELRQRHYLAYLAQKPPGSVKDGISRLKGFKIHLVTGSPGLKFEQENYHQRKVRGIAQDEPADLHNHIWDAARYCAAHYNLRAAA